MSLDTNKTNPELGQKVHEHLVKLGVETPMLNGDGVKPKKKVAVIERHVAAIMDALHLDRKDDSLVETPTRVAKMYANEIFWGLDYSNFPKITTVENKAGYHDMLVEKVTIKSQCVVGSSLVETPRGRVPISQLKDGDWIYTMDPETFELRLAKAQNPHKTQENAELVEVYTDNDTVFCTPEHRFLTLNRGWVPAEHLKPGDSLASLYRTVNDNGYITLSTSNPNKKKRKNPNPFKVAEHVFVWEQTNKQKHATRENGKMMVIHHVDENKWNNLPENLNRITVGEHNIAHQRTQNLADNEYRKLMAAEASGRPEVRKKRSDSVRAHWANMTPAEYEARCAAMRNNHTVVAVRKAKHREDVWNMEVEGTHNFFISGICVHNCEHHFVYFGTAHNPDKLGCWVAYIPKDKVVGLSKINRVVEFFSRRPQIQERLTRQIAETLKFLLETDDVAVVMRSQHFCVLTRGIEDADSYTVSSHVSGAFERPEVRAELMSIVNK